MVIRKLQKPELLQQNGKSSQTLKAYHFYHSHSGIKVKSILLASYSTAITVSVCYEGRCYWIPVLCNQKEIWFRSSVNRALWQHPITHRVLTGQWNHIRPKTSRELLAPSSTVGLLERPIEFAGLSMPKNVIYDASDISLLSAIWWLYGASWFSLYT